MSKELVIGSNRHETKVAILEEDQLTEIYFQRGNEYSLAGSIHKGRVTRVLPGMQSAFVDLGLERDTFLYVSDFFEENDDIDTVSDEKPQRNDRRERGQPRLVERPPIIVSEPATPIAPPEPVAPVKQALPPAPEAAASTAAPIGAELSQQRQSDDRSDGDRGGRGDRRGRRSRRRRPRGRGFPENKYAQPGANEQGDRESRPAIPEFEQAEQERDVIMLPGESLAKYRHATAAPGESEPFAEDEEDLARDAPDVEMTDLDREVERNEELDEQAQEIESTDRIFSHHDDEAIDEEEEKLQEVKEDQLSSPFVVEDIEEEQESDKPSPAPNTPRRSSVEVRPPSAVEPLQSSALYFLEEQTPFENESTIIVREPFDGPASQIDHSQPTHNFEASSGSASASQAPDLIEVEPLEPLEPLEPADFEGADLEDVRGAVDLAPPETAESLSEPNATGVQTASVREQGGRYMHRVSRRMRRRRGGNRPLQTTAGDADSDSSGGQGTGAAAVLQPEAVVESRRESNERRESSEERSTERPERVMPSITELLKPGQEIIVQIAKEPLGQKGARITSHVALPGRYVVFMPSVGHLGVSRKIESDEERQRLKRILQTYKVGTTGGFIVRTAGEGVPEEEIAADMDFLYKLWLDIRQKAEKRPAPLLLHYDLDIVQRILRDQVTEDFKAIWVDSEEMYENVLSFTQRFQPNLVSRVKMYTRSAPIFDAFGITQELEKALRPKVWLKSGGYIVINQTEALVAIDINTGKYVGKSNRLEDTIVKTNTEAVKEIVRQIRLRDLGGIIVVDFIDMDERKNRQKVMQALEEAMQADRAPYKILQFNDFGLVAITRKRVKQSLERTLCAPCPYCEGAGYVKSVQTIIGEILVEAQKIAKAIEGKDVMLRVHTDVAKVLKASDNHHLEELEEILKRPVLVKGDPALHHEKFDLG